MLASFTACVRVCPNPAIVRSRQAELRFQSLVPRLGAVSTTPARTTPGKPIEMRSDTRPSGFAKLTTSAATTAGRFGGVRRVDTRAGPAIIGAVGIEHPQPVFKWLPPMSIASVNGPVVPAMSCYLPLMPQAPRSGVRGARTASRMAPAMGGKPAMRSQQRAFPGAGPGNQRRHQHRPHDPGGIAPEVRPAGYQPGSTAAKVLRGRPDRSPG